MSTTLTGIVVSKTLVTQTSPNLMTADTPAEALITLNVNGSNITITENVVSNEANWPLGSTQTFTKA